MTEEYGRWVCPSSSGGKFWTISRTGKSISSNFGKVRTKGQSHSRTFTTEQLAIDFVESQIKEKERKGYKRTASKKQVEEKKRAKADAEDGNEDKPAKRGRKKKDDDE